MEDVSPVIREKKKKILILSCKGGYGHESASHSIQEMVGELYSCQVVFPIEEVSQVGPYIAANSYNMLIKNNWIRTMNFISTKLAPLLLQAMTNKIKALLIEHIKREQPDLVLSVIPFVNYPASEAAKDCNVPYLLVSIDNDLTNWTLGLNKITHPDFKMTISRFHSLTSGLLKKSKVEDSRIEKIGLPIHPAFLQKGNKEQLKKEFDIPLYKPVVMVMMGGAGGRGALAYAQELAQIGFPLHVIICTGNNSLLYAQMKELVAGAKADVSFSVLQFTDRVADLMQIADLLITKPGPGTINEALMRKLPILVDNTHSSLFWERTNLDFIARSELGQIISSPKEIKKWVPLYLYDPAVKNALSKAYDQIQLPCFQENILRILDAMIASSVPR